MKEMTECPDYEEENNVNGKMEEPEWKFLMGLKIRVSSHLPAELWGHMAPMDLECTGFYVSQELYDRIQKETRKMK